MPTCYAITEGDYSNYRVLAVFTTRELAEAQQPHYGIYTEIEEFPLDRIVPLSPAGMRGYSCCMSLFYRSRNPLSDPPTIVVSPLDNAAMIRTTAGEVDDTPYKRIVHVWARDTQHATKIASKKFVQYILQYRATQAGAA